MDPIEQLVTDILEDRVAVETLTTEQLDQVIDCIYDNAQDMLDGPQAEAAGAILASLENLIDERLTAEDMSCFDEQIIAAEARGSVYFEFEEYSVH